MEVWEIPSVTTHQRKYRGRKRQTVTRETEPGVSPNKQKRSMKVCSRDQKGETEYREQGRKAEP